MTKETKYRLLLLIVLAILAYFPLFLHLERWTIRMWDESRLSVNSFEMMQSGRILVTTYEGVPDMWNTKPAMLIWLQAISMKLFGANELAIRLPSALAGFGTMMLLFLFFSRKLARSDIGIFSGLTLMTTSGYVSHHVTRTGDYDALLILFMICIMVFAFLWVEHKKLKYLVWAAVATACMGLTKGVQGFVMFPGIALFLLVDKKLLWVLRQKSFWIAGVLSLLAILSYYVAREQFNPGYMEEVWIQELGGRFMREKGSHMQPLFYHLENIIYRQFVPWVYILPVGIVLGLLSGNQVIRRITGYFTIVALTYFFFISMAKTKLDWYTAPLYPMFSVIVGIGVAELIRRVIGKIDSNKTNLKVVLPIVLSILIFSIPYARIIDFAYNPLEGERHNWWQHKIGECLRQLDHYDQLNISFAGYNAHAIFYIKALNAEGKDMKSFYTPDLPEGELALICQDSARKILKEQFEFEHIEDCIHCEVVRILKKLD